MLTKKLNSLGSILNSSDGVHFTAYIKNESTAVHLKHQIYESIENAKEYLKSVMTQDNLSQFLEPLVSLAENDKIIKKIKGNIGLFRTENSFRILHLPIDVENTFIVATSFHVKPLLKWMQIDRDFILVKINDSAAEVYHGNQNDLKHIDTTVLPDSIQKIDLDSCYQQEFEKCKNNLAAQKMLWLCQWINDMTAQHKPMLFLTGKNEFTDQIIKKIKYDNKLNYSIFSKLSENSLNDTVNKVRDILKTDAQQRLKLSLLEFKYGLENDVVKRNIFEISKIAVQGKIKKLIIADGVNIFGKIDKKTGGLVINPIDMDYEDDCLLDDLAQTVLAYGGEVIIANKHDIPTGRPVLALIEKPYHEPIHKFYKENKTSTKLKSSGINV